MAEFVLGGVRIAVVSNRTWEAQSCAHRDSLVTTCGSLVRIVCESCGHISLRPHGGLRGPVDRERFARPADALHDTLVDLTEIEAPRAFDGTPYSPKGVFAPEEKVSI